jgi:hypothetical protein
MQKIFQTNKDEFSEKIRNYVMTYIYVRHGVHIITNSFLSSKVK